MVRDFDPADPCSFVTIEEIRSIYGTDTYEFDDEATAQLGVCIWRSEPTNLGGSFFFFFFIIIIIGRPTYDSRLNFGIPGAAWNPDVLRSTDTSADDGSLMVSFTIPIGTDLALSLNPCINFTRADGTFDKTPCDQDTIGQTFAAMQCVWPNAVASSALTLGNRQSSLFNVKACGRTTSWTTFRDLVGLVVRLLDRETAGHGTDSVSAGRLVWVLE